MSKVPGVEDDEKCTCGRSFFRPIDELNGIELELVVLSVAAADNLMVINEALSVVAQRLSDRVAAVSNVLQARDPRNKPDPKVP